ncbi:MAG TPA: hypothetical protein VNG90_03090 [Candidatus Acidoferrum sp.]|nr:hypothetical protein [Candidatus Acidoferrum sp.]
MVLSRVAFKNVNWVFVYAFLGVLAIVLWVTIQSAGRETFLTDAMLVPGAIAIVGLFWRQYKSAYFLTIGLVSLFGLLAGLGLNNFSRLDCGPECLEPAASTWELLVYGLIWVGLPLLLPFVTTKYVSASANPKQKLTLAQRLLLISVIFDVIEALISGTITIVGTLVVVAFGGVGHFLDMLLILLPIIDAVTLYKFVRKPVTARTSTYFTLSRIVFIGVIMWQYWGEFTDTSATNNSLNSLIWPTILGFLFYSFCALVIYRETRAKRQLWTLLAVAAIALTAIAISGIIVNSTSTSTFGPFGIRHDNQVASDFDFLSGNIQDFALHDNHFPTSLKQAVNVSTSLDTDSHVSERISRYRYLPDNQTGTFQLCATFAYATASANHSNDTSLHKAGYQCFTYSTD